jgi:hypothetical protein
LVDPNDQLIARNNGTGFGTQLVKINIGTAGPLAPEGDDSGDAGIASALASTVTASATSPSSTATGSVQPNASTVEPSTAASTSIRPTRMMAAAWYAIGIEHSADGDQPSELFGSDDGLLDLLASSRRHSEWRRR